MNIFAFILNLFCDTQQINKILIEESYDDYINEIKCFSNRYPHLKESNYINNYQKLNEEDKIIFDNYFNKVKKLKQIVVNNLVIYSKNYPNEKISKNRFIKEYIEYPYRLEQNIDNVILEL